jgi:hypothetical protein
MTSGTTIGSYTASGNGEITFSVPLGSLHTFRIGEFEESAGGPAIISFAPISPIVNDYTGATRSFNITVNQPVNVTWYLNGVVIKNSEKGVTQASYTNTSAVQGTWTVNATAVNANGTVSKEWIWNVANPSTLLSISFINPTPANGATITQNFAFINTSIANSLNTAAFIDWNRSLAAWWRLNNEAGETPTLFRDSSSWGNNGTCSGTTCPTFTPGKFGNALQFDGVNDYVNAGTGGSVTGSLTITAWVKRGTNNAWRTIVSKGESKQEYYHNYVLYVSPTNTLAIGFGKNDGATYREFETTSAIDTNWHHIVAIINSATDMKIYVDGVSQAGTFSGSISTVLTANSKKLLIGSSSSTTEFFIGAIDEVTIWNRGLSPEEIMASYDAGINRLSRNFTNIQGGSYTYKAYVQNISGTVNQTETRTLTFIGTAGITVISPNGGENWARGSTQMIKWSYAGTPGPYVEIDLLKGGILNQVINSNTPLGSSGSGSYSWLINSTQALGSDYTIRVKSTSDPAYTDVSNNNITINAVISRVITLLNNNATYLNTPTYEVSGQATHPDIYYNASGWNGYKYWMGMTPYPGGNAQFENPSVLASNDGISWVVPGGLVNPIDLTPSAGSNSDAEIIFNEILNRLEVYYVESGAGISYFKRRTSTDGIHWSNEQDIFNVPDYQIMSPAIIRTNGVYQMWYDDASSCSAPATYVRYRTSTDGLNWSGLQNVIIAQSGQNIWHIEVNYMPAMNEYWMIYAAYPAGSTCGNTELYFAKSTDKINWITYSNKILGKSTSWDSGQIYRATFLYDEITDIVRVWYSARNNANIWHIGYTIG